MKNGIFCFSSAREDDLILVTDEKTEALQQSVSLLFKERSSDFISVSFLETIETSFLSFLF